MLVKIGTTVLFSKGKCKSIHENDEKVFELNYSFLENCITRNFSRLQKERIEKIELI